MTYGPAPHTLVPLITRADEAAAAQADAAAQGHACFTAADTLAMRLDRYAHQWDARDLPLLKRLRELLVEADEIARRIVE